MIGSALSLNRMLSLAWDGLLTLCSLVIHAIKGVSLFIFDSIFPPVHDVGCLIGLRVDQSCASSRFCAEQRHVEAEAHGNP